MPEVRRYIAYGSNLHLEQMKRRCPTAEVLGTAWLRGWALRFRHVATIERCSRREMVPVLVWSIQPEDEKALDRYEGWPFLYRKETVKVWLGRKRVPAMVYTMNVGVYPYGAPDQSYYRTIREGYESAGFDTGILDRAVEDSLRRAAQVNAFMKGLNENDPHRI